MADEEGGDLLLGSIEEFDQEYDNVLLKFERFQKNVEKKQSIKFYWTFWFLIKSVIFPSIIPIIIALPLAYVYFRVEGVYISGNMAQDLIVFWVMAWIFLMDLIHLCHWFTYEEIPIIQEGEDVPETPEAGTQDKKVDSDLITPNIAYAPKKEHDRNSIISAISFASHSTAFIATGFENRRRSSLMPSNHSSSLAAMKRASQVHTWRQSFSAQKKLSLAPNSISEKRSESEESDVLLDVIPMNPDFFQPDPFLQKNAPSQGLDMLKEDSEERNGSINVSNESNAVKPKECAIPMDSLVEESEENLKIPDKMGISTEDIRHSENNLSFSTNSPLDALCEIKASQPLDPSAIKASSNHGLDNASSEGSLPYVPIKDISSQNAHSSEILKSSNYDLDNTSSHGSLPEVPMNNFFSQNEQDSFGNQIPKEVRKDRIADTGDYEKLPKKIAKKPSHGTFNFKRRRTTIRQVVYDPYEDDNTTVTHFSAHRRSTQDDRITKKESESTIQKIHESKGEDEEKDEDADLIWSPLFYHMIWKFIFRWTVTPLFISLSKTSVLITLVVYPFLVVPGSLIAHMFTVTSWIYPIFLRFLTSLLTVIMTEMINQFMFYSMIAPLAFIDIRFSSSTDQDVGLNITKGVLKAIIFFLARTIVKFAVIYSDRKEIQRQREKNLNQKEVKASKDELDNSFEKIPDSSDSQKANAVQVVYEDELVDLSYYGQLILALGGHGVPGWMFIFRIEDHLQFAFAAVGSLVMEALMVVSFKNFMDWTEKRKERKKKTEEKEKIREAKKASKLSKGLKRKGSITPNMDAIKGIKPEDRKKNGIKDAPSFKGQKITPEISKRASGSVKNNQLGVGSNALRKDSSRGSIFEIGKNEPMALLAATAFHQDNRRQAVERRFYMCSTYAAIIGAATIFMIFSTGDGNQNLCSYYGKVGVTTVLWRLVAVLSVQFVVDWWFTLNQLMWGLPFAFTAQIETTIVHGFLVTSLSILQSVTVLMAHERGLFGSC